MLLGAHVPHRGLGLGWRKETRAHRDGERRGSRRAGLALDALRAREGVVLRGSGDRRVGRALDNDLGRRRAALGAEARRKRRHRAHGVGLGAVGDAAAYTIGVAALLISKRLKEVILAVLGHYHHGAGGHGVSENLAGHRARLHEGGGVRALLDDTDNLEALRIALRDDNLAHRHEHGALGEEAARRAAVVLALLIAQAEEGVAERLLHAVELDARLAVGRALNRLCALVLRRSALGYIRLGLRLGRHLESSWRLGGLEAWDSRLLSRGALFVGGYLVEEGGGHSILFAPAEGLRPLGPLKKYFQRGLSLLTYG